MTTSDEIKACMYDFQTVLIKILDLWGVQLMKVEWRCV